MFLRLYLCWVMILTKKVTLFFNAQVLYFCILIFCDKSKIHNMQTLNQKRVHIIEETKGTCKQCVQENAQPLPQNPVMLVHLFILLNSNYCKYVLYSCFSLFRSTCCIYIKICLWYLKVSIYYAYIVINFFGTSRYIVLNGSLNMLCSKLVFAPY